MPPFPMVSAHFLENIAEILLKINRQFKISEVGIFWNFIGSSKPSEILTEISGAHITMYNV